jgi:hypothetical protein
MTDRFTSLTIALAFVCASPVWAQSKKPSALYEPAAETTIAGVVTGVVSVAGADGTVGVHLNVKTTDGKIVRVHLGPAMFIGMNDFYFLMDDLVAIKGADVVHDGEVGFWARLISKGGKTLTLRSDDGTPRWPFATEEDPDGCGVSHGPIRY